MEVRDLNLAAALVASGIALASVEGRETHAVFVFEASERIGEIEAKFHARQLSVDAASYGEALRSLKAAAMAARAHAVPVYRE